MLRTRFALAAVVASAASASALANSFTPLTMPTLNTNIRTFTDGSVYDNLWPTNVGVELLNVQFITTPNAGLNPLFATPRSAGELDA